MSEPVNWNKIKSTVKTIVWKYRILRLIAIKIQQWIQRCKPISGKNNVIMNQGFSLNLKYDIKGDNNRIEIMQGTVLSNVRIYIRGNNHHLIIREKCEFNGGGVRFEDDCGRIEIGPNTCIQSAYLIVSEPNKKIIIGENCLFSVGIELRTGDAHSIIDNVTKKRINYAQDILVGNHVWVGAHATILKGVHVGNNSIIGTGSVVTRDVPDHSIVAGIPATVIKQDIDWVSNRIYEN